MVTMSYRLSTNSKIILDQNFTMQKRKSKVLSFLKLSEILVGRAFDICIKPKDISQFENYKQKENYRN